MTSYLGISAEGSSRQHNGDVINNNVVIHRERTFFNTLSQEERDSRLLQAAADGQVRRMQLLINAHADVDYLGLDGFTALHKAVINDYLDCVELLLESGADINARSRFGYTALGLAAKQGSPECVSFLVEKRADVNISAKLVRVSPLHSAAARGNLDMVNSMIATRRVYLDAREYVHQLTPLLVAAREGHQEVIDRLIEAGANVAARDSDNRSYLDYRSTNREAQAPSDINLLGQMQRMHIRRDVDARTPETTDATLDTNQGLANNPIAAVGSISNSVATPEYVTDIGRKWLTRCLREMEKDPPPYCSAAPDGDKLLLWNAAIIGPPNSPYSGGLFHLKIRFPPDIPWKPPRVYFTTKVYHPNISPDDATFAAGTVDVDILRDKWSAAWRVDTILISIVSLLNDPNPNEACAVNREAALLFRTNRAKYDEIVREWTTKYAS